MSATTPAHDVELTEKGEYSRKIHGLSKQDLAPPTALNLALSVVVAGVWLGLQWWAARQSSYLAVVGIGVCFSLLGLTLYALMHETFHRSLSDNDRINEIFGVALSALFPGSYTMMRATHLGHHRRNRTDAELFDAYYPGESVWKKRAFFYAMYIGTFWLTVPAAMFLVIVWPSLLRARLLMDGPHTSAMIQGVPKRYFQRIRLESLGALLLQVVLFWALDLNWVSYLTLYGLYALCWSSQNYITHAFSPRDILNGAYNLRIGKLYSLLLLNFNWHLAHHQHPSVPWIHLPRLDDKTRERPHYVWAFLRFWRGPQPCTEPPPKLLGARHKPSKKAAPDPSKEAL